jgi:hypothetical protein
MYWECVYIVLVGGGSQKGEAGRCKWVDVARWGIKEAKGIGSYSSGRPHKLK